MALGFKEFFHTLGKALITAADEMEQNNQSQSNDDCTDNYDPYKPLNNTEYECNMKGTEYEEFDQKITRDKQDDQDPDAYNDNEQGENNFNEDEYSDDENNNELAQDDNQNNDDESRQGNVRYVEGAHLVTRKQVDDGTYEELWIFNIDEKNSSRSDKIIKSILKGTDIPENEISSDDGSQDYTVWCVGNVQMVKVRGLPE